MANYEHLIKDLKLIIRTNGNNEITGKLLQDTLLAIIDSLAKNMLFAGIADPATDPPITDENVFYFASVAGNYSNFDPSINVIAGELAIIRNTPNEWIKERVMLLTGGGGFSVQADWNQTNSSEPDYIKNKPTIPDAQIQSDWDQINVSELDYIKNKPDIPDAQIPSDWDQTDSNKLDYIFNKPTIPDAQKQADWDQTDSLQADFIKNKPEIPINISDLNDDSDFITESEVDDKISDHDTDVLAHGDIRQDMADLEQSIGDGEFTIKRDSLDSGTTFRANQNTNVSLNLALGSMAGENKADYEIVANKDFSIPATPTAGHYPTTSAIKSYVDSVIGGIPTQLFFYSFDYGQFASGYPIISGKTAGEELYNFADDKNWQWDGSVWIDISSSMSKVPVDGSTALIQQKFVDGIFAGFPGTAIHEYYGGVSIWYPFPQFIAAPDNVTIGFNGAGQFQVKAGAITATEIESTIMALITGAAKATDVATALANIYTKSESDAKFALITSLVNFYTKTEADGKFALISSLTSFYTKTEADGKFALISSLTNFYTKTEADTKFLQSITKVMVEAVLTGNITTHQHDQYLQSITKAMVEDVLTGNITTHTHDSYLTAITKVMIEAVFTGLITTHQHNYLSNSFQAQADFWGGQDVSTLSNLAITKERVTLTSNAGTNQTLSITSIAQKDRAVAIRVTATAEINVTLPATGGIYINLIGDTTIAVASGKTIIIIVHQDSSDDIFIISNLIEK